MRKHPFYSCDSCEDGSSTKNQILKGARGQAGATGKQGPTGVAGKGSLVVGSMFSNTGPTAAEIDGADELLISDTLAILKSSGLDVDEIATIKPALDETDLSHIKTKVRFSNGLLNWLAKWLIPKTISAADAAGKVLVSTGTQAGQFVWQALSASFFDKYKVTSASTVAYGLGNKSFTVGPDLAWSTGVIARATSSIGYVEGVVVSYTGGVLVINADRFSGVGDSNLWLINIGSREVFLSPVVTLPVGISYAALVSNGTGYLLQPIVNYNPGNITTRTIPIGTWNMNSTYTISVDLSSIISDVSKIVSLDCIIFDDAGLVCRLERVSTAFLLYGAIGDIDPVTKIVPLTRKVSPGLFADGNFSSVSINRGYFTIQYLP